MEAVTRAAVPRAGEARVRGLHVAGQLYQGDARHTGPARHTGQDDPRGHGADPPPRLLPGIESHRPAISSAKIKLHCKPGRFDKQF